MHRLFFLTRARTPLAVWVAVALLGCGGQSVSVPSAPPVPMAKQIPETDSSPPAYQWTCTQDNESSMLNEEFELVGEQGVMNLSMVPPRLGNFSVKKYKDSGLRIKPRVVSQESMQWRHSGSRLSSLVPEGSRCDPINMSFMPFGDREITDVFVSQEGLLVSQGTGIHRFESPTANRSGFYKASETVHSMGGASSGVVAAMSSSYTFRKGDLIGLNPGTFDELWRIEDAYSYPVMSEGDRFYAIVEKENKGHEGKEDYEFVEIDAQTGEVERAVSVWGRTVSWMQKKGLWCTYCLQGIGGANLKNHRICMLKRLTW